MSWRQEVESLRCKALAAKLGRLIAPAGRPVDLGGPAGKGCKSQLEHFVAFAADECTIFTCPAPVQSGAQQPD